MPSPIRVVTSQDGPRLTVNDLLNEPLAIPTRIVDLANELFVTDQILRDAGGNDSGVVKFYTSDPLFAETNAEDVSEGAEIPLVMTDRGQLTLAHTRKKSLGIRITREMRDRNQMDEVQRQMRVVANTMAKTWEDTFLAQLLAAIPAAHQAAAAIPWENVNTTPRKDLLLAKKRVQTRQNPDGTASATGTVYGFNPDTLIIPADDEFALLGNDDAWKAWQSGGSPTDLNPEITGVMPTKLYGFDVIKTFSTKLTSGNAIVVERKTVGFYSDEIPLESEPVEYSRNTQSYRSNTTRESAIGVDQPLAAALVTGTV